MHHVFRESGAFGGHGDGAGTERCGEAGLHVDWFL